MDDKNGFFWGSILVLGLILISWLSFFGGMESVIGDCERYGSIQYDGSVYSCTLESEEKTND